MGMSRHDADSASRAEFGYFSLDLKWIGASAHVFELRDKERAEGIYLIGYHLTYCIVSMWL